ncbi:MAG: hypothetical protein FWD46_00770 [Cystobacterineae bacterium]|nr:hypothetical protein [Cystobacterineae bacterium]
MKIDFDLKAYSLDNVGLMLCPECGSQAADNAAFCPKCDHILDPSLFLDDLPAEPDEDSNPRVPPPSFRAEERSPHAQRPSSRLKNTHPRTQPPSSGTEDTNPRIQLPPSRQKTAAEKRGHTPSSRHKAMAPPDSGPSRERGSSKHPPLPPEETPEQSNEKLTEQWVSNRAEKSEFNEAEVLLNSLKVDFLAQTGPDKLMIVGAVGMIASCFFPWRSMERSGDILGFLSLGVWVVPLALGSVGGMLWRKRTREVFPIFPWLLQGLSGAMAILLCLVLIKVFWVSKSPELIGARMESSTPSLGLFLGLVFSMINLSGTGLGLKKH